MKLPEQGQVLGKVEGEGEGTGTGTGKLYPILNNSSKNDNLQIPLENDDASSIQSLNSSFNEDKVIPDHHNDFNIMKLRQNSVDLTKIHLKEKHKQLSQENHTMTIKELNDFFSSNYNEIGDDNQANEDRDQAMDVDVDIDQD